MVKNTLESGNETGETGNGKTKLRDSVSGYQQHIRQPEYHKLKVKEYLRTCGKGTFKTFPLLQMQSSEIDLCGSYKRNFRKKHKTKLNNLQHETKLCTRSIL